MEDILAEDPGPGAALGRAREAGLADPEGALVLPGAGRADRRPRLRRHTTTAGTGAGACPGVW